MTNLRFKFFLEQYHSVIANFLYTFYRNSGLKQAVYSNINWDNKLPFKQIMVLQNFPKLPPQTFCSPIIYR